MVKSTLIKKILDCFPELTPELAEKIVNVFFDHITQSLIYGDGTEIRKFGSFYIKHKKSYIGRNPKTNEKISLPAKNLPAFRPSRTLLKQINN